MTGPTFRVLGALAAAIDHLHRALALAGEVRSVFEDRIRAEVLATCLVVGTVDR